MIFRQTGLFDEQQGNIFLKKHSALAQINNVTSLVQRKSINAILRIAKDQLKRDPSQTSFQIDMGVLKNLAGITNNDNIGLKNGLKSLVSLVIEYNILKKDTYEWGAFPFLSFVKIEGAKRGKIAKVVFSLSPPILESLAKPSMYVKLNLFLQRGFKSKYSLALFEVLSDYMKIGKLKLEIDTLRTLLGIEPHKYSVFAMFRKKVLDIAMREINKLTEMEVSYKAEKIGRKYGIITFLIEGKIEETNMEEARTKIIEKLNFYGFKEKQTNFLLKKHDEDYLLANIGIIEEMLENGKKIKDVKAYLSKAFLTDFRKEETEFDKVKKEKQTVLAEEKVAIEKQELAKNALK